MDLRPLLIISGTVHVASNRPRTDKSRRAGNVLAVVFFKRIRELTILHTPWGRLVDERNHMKVESLIQQLSIDVDTHNDKHGCLVENTLICEQLDGARRAAVMSWLDRKLRDKDFEVTNAVERVQPDHGDQIQPLRLVRGPISG